MLAIRVFGSTWLASMSSANESNPWPPGVSNSMPRMARRKSVPTSWNRGRYHATTRRPFAWAASMNWACLAGRTNAYGRLQLEVSRYSVWTPWALTADGVVVGFLETAFDPSDSSWCIGGVVIDAGQQGRGIGRALMQQLVADLRGRPECRLVALTVHEDNAVARALYRSMGFTETGERDDDELVMVLPAAGPA